MGKTKNRNSRRLAKKKESEMTLSDESYSLNGGMGAVILKAKVKKIVDLKMEIENEMRKIGYERKTREISFVSLDFIAELYQSTDPQKLQLSLQQDLDKAQYKPGFDEVRIEKLQEYVRNQACRLYAVLVLAGQSQIIVRLYKEEHRVTDCIFDKGENRGDVSYCSKEHLRTLPHLRDFAETIFEHQWYIPPVLCRDVVQKFPIKFFRFPFSEEPQFIGGGAGGQVYKVKIAPGHLKKSTGYIEGDVVVHKEILKGKMTEERITREVDTIRARQHANIIPLFACFFAGREKPFVKAEEVLCLHLLFEHADAGDMATWLMLDEAPARLMDTVARQKHIIDTVEQIVSAVAFIHSKIDGYTSCHHDLKPGNIVRFERFPAIWKICDFGMANLKHHQDDSGTVRRSDNKFGTYNYQPPEYFDDDKNIKHGRPFDVWSLGCILLELATIWKHGWSDAGMTRYRVLIEEYSQRASRAKKNGDRGIDCSFHNNRDAVSDWIHQLGADHNGDDDFKKFLGLISEMLVDKSQRIFVWEVEMDLFEMVNSNCSNDELRKHFRLVVQQSETPLNALNNEHNPLKRANERGKDWQKDILRQNQWSIDEPEPVRQLIIKRRETFEHYTTMNNCILADEFEENSLIGRHNLDLRITNGFSDSICVGLYGISGIGKSHMAYSYTARFRNTHSTAKKKHTFWVNAVSKPMLDESVRRIAEIVALNILTAEDLYKSMRNWLNNVINGPWIIVIDGLNCLDVAKVVKSLIPKDGGQVLITTRDRTILDHLGYLLPDDRGKACFRVEQLSAGELRLLFQRQNEDVLPDTIKMDDLLSSLFSPSSTKSLANYALNNNIPTSGLYGEMKKASDNGCSLGFPRDSYVNSAQMDCVLQPLCNYTDSFAASDNKINGWPSQELRLLGQLSCFDNDKIGFELISQDYSNVPRLRELLGVLEKCCFVTKSETNQVPLNFAYTIYQSMQELVRRWILEKMGFVSLLNLHQSVLCVLLVAYKERKKVEADANKIRRHSYRWKAELMPHFKRFLRLAREYELELDSIPTSDFDCNDRTVSAVITFAQAFLDEGRYPDAICVLDFIRRLYKGTLHRPSLIRHLCKAYNMLPLERRKEQELMDATRMLEMVIKECNGQTEEEQEQRWLCLLDLANLHCKASKPDKASQVLGNLQELSMVLRNGKPQLRQQGEVKFDPSLERELAIRKLVEESRVHQARADRSISGRLETRNLQRARTTLKDAKSAVENWFPRESQWVSELHEDIADVSSKMRDPKLNKEAIETYENLIRQFVRESSDPEQSWYQLRIWDLKCKKAKAQMQLDLPRSDPSLKEAIGTFREALEFYEKNFGKHNGQHDGHTRVCAHLLQEAYERDGNVSKAREIEELYYLQHEPYDPSSEFDAEDNILDRNLLVGSLLVFIAITMYLYRLYTTTS